MKNSNEGFGHENFGKVTYIIGTLNGVIDGLDNWDEITMVAEQIVMDWQNRYDIQNEEEEGYIMAYAERILFERYGK